MDTVENFCKIQNEGLELFVKKNSDYGDSYKENGLIGVLVRLGDKIRRLQNITDNNISLVHDESLRDTLIDLQNYSTMAIMLYDESKNKIKKNLVVSEAGIGNMYK